MADQAIALPAIEIVRSGAPSAAERRSEQMPLDLSKVKGVTMQSPKDLAKSPTFLFYGRGKTGKTTLAMSASVVEEMSPVAIVDFEGSAEVGATTYPNVDVYRTETWQQSSAVLDAMIDRKSTRLNSSHVRIS